MAGTFAQVQVEVTRFNKVLPEYARAVGLSLSATTKLAAARLEAMLKDGTPVDTGRARNSWHTVHFGESPAYSYADNKGHTFDGNLGVTPKSDRQAVVGADVVYMLSLEAGHSRQAPSGWIRSSVAAFRAQLLEAVKAAKGSVKKP